MLSVSSASDIKMNKYNHTPWSFHLSEGDRQEIRKPINGIISSNGKCYEEQGNVIENVCGL